jgi:hypothetical protein
MEGKRVWVLAALLALSLAAGCGRSDEIDSALPTQTIQPADSGNPPAPSLTIQEVQSYQYIIATVAGVAGIGPSYFSANPAQLLITGGSAAEGELAGHTRDFFDPSHSKLVIGYIIVAEAPFSEQTELPPWVGGENPAWPGLYSVQFWDPDWHQVLFRQIDNLISGGYDGVLLDVMNGDLEWSEGNILGNPVYPEAGQAMANLLLELRSYVDSKDLDRAFYLVGNSPITVAQRYPAALSSLDAILNESVFFTQLPYDGSVAAYNGLGPSQWIAAEIAPLYDSAGVPVLGNDYPPLTDTVAVFESFAFYAALGWIPSVNAVSTRWEVLSTGPYIAMAVGSNPIVTGAPNLVNFLSGGRVPFATLIGGDRGDYFIGGPGMNSIRGGAGDDTIYAHPEIAARKNMLEITVAADVVNATLPLLSITINRSIMLPPTEISADRSRGETQHFEYNIAGYGTITSLVLTGSGIYNIDSTH